MKKVVLIFCVLFAALGAGANAGSTNTMMSSAMAPTIVMPDTIKWMPLEGMQGAWMAVVYGTPKVAGSGQYVIRYKVNDGVKFPVHYHTQLEQVTVLSGTLMVGLGDKFDASKLTALEAGSFASIPANVHHYAMAKGETVVQVQGPAPVSMEMVK